MALMVQLGQAKSFQGLMLSRDAAEPVQEAVIPMLAGNTQAFTCLSSLPAQEATAAGDPGLGDPPAPTPHSTANLVQQIHVIVPQESLCPLPFHSQTPHAMSSWDLAVGTALEPIGSWPRKAASPTWRTRGGED